MRLVLALLAASLPAYAQTYIPPTRSVPTGLAPGMQSKLLKSTPDEQVYALTFAHGDEAFSGLTDFAVAHHIADAHFTAIGAASSALLAWFDLGRKQYRAIPVTGQTEVLSMVGDIAAGDHQGKPVIHTHAVLGHPDGTTTGGHIFELHVDPTLEVFLTVNMTPLAKKPDARSGLLLIEPSE